MAERASRDERRVTRRRLLGAVGVGATAGLAGCLDVITGDEPVTFEATAATVGSATLDETGYEHQGTRSDTATREFAAGGESRSVEVVNRLAEYDRGVDVPTVGRLQAAVFTAFSTPQVDVLGQTFNPVEDMSTGDLAEMIQQRYDRIQNLREEDSRTVSLLGESTTATRYAGEARLAGEGVTVDIYVTITEPVMDGEDFVLAFGGYPQIIDERGAITTMIQGVEHGE